MQFDYIIVGQGLAGSILAYQLLDREKTVLILNDENLPTSSAVAGGIFNPVTGKDLSKTWMADELLPQMREFYQNLENKFSAKFLHQTNIYRPFINENQKQQFLKLIEKQEIQEYIQPIDSKENYSEIRHFSGSPYGLLTKKSGWVDVPLILDFLKEYFIRKNAYSIENFNLNELQIAENQVFYKDFEAQKIIFCQGFYAAQNPLFNWLRFNSVKGETLLAEIENYSIQEIVNQGAWILPIRGNLCRLGASYTWKPLDWKISEEIKIELQTKIDKFLIPKYRITDHQAGIRPATQDRRPFLGNHPAHKNVYIFNGLGTKGVSLAPYFAKKLIDFMENQKDLSPEVNIEREYALYSL